MSAQQEKPGPSSWGRYRLIEVVGEGGMGRIYKAYDPALNRYVAVKILKVDDPVLVRRFLREAKSQAKVDHPCICKVYEAGIYEGKPFIVMQYIRGQTLDKAHHEMPLEAKVKVIRDVALALHAAHKNGLIHRDMKPTNIMVERSEDGDWKAYVVDFGLAKEKEIGQTTITHMIIGTPPFMSPEQAKGKNKMLDRRTDVYGLGATLYTILAGRPPFEGGVLEVIKKLIEEEPVPLRKINRSIPRDLETIVMKCLEKDLQRRYESAKALAEDLDRFLNGEPVKAQRASFLYRAAKKLKKYRAVALLLAGVLLVSSALSIASLRSRWKQKKITSLAREYDMEIRYIENMLWYAYTKPIHDIRGELSLIRDRLRLLEKLIKEKGSLSLGPGYYALGKGYMALGDYRTARKYLKLAWEKYGYRTPEVSYSLGITLAMIYLQEAEKASQLNDESIRERKLKELERIYLSKASKLLQTKRPNGAQPWEYGKAILAFIRGNYPLAIKRLRQAYARFPWLYEAKTLEGDIYVTMAEQEKKAGNREKALALFQKAEQVYRELLKKGESFSKAYNDLCRLQSRVMELLIYQTDKTPKQALEKAISSCNRAIEINPEDVTPYVLLAKAHLHWARYLIFKGNDPEPDIKKSLSFADKALTLQENYIPALLTKGEAYLIQASYVRGEGRNPTMLLSKAIDYYNRVLETNPSDPSALSGIASAYWNRACYYRDTGRTSMEDLRKAEFLLKELLAIEPNSYIAYNSLGNVYFDMSLAEEVSERERENFLEKSISSYRQALRINPNFALAHSNLAHILLLKAKALKRKGKACSSCIEEAEKEAKRAIELKANLLWAYMTAGRVKLFRAKGAMETGGSPSSFLREAENYASRALELSQNYPEALLLISKIYLLRAERKFLEGKNPETFVKSGLKLIKEIELNRPYRAEALIIKAKLLFIQAQWEGNPEKARKALVCLQKAFKLNKRLAEEEKHREEEILAFIEKASRK